MKRNGVKRILNGILVFILSTRTFKFPSSSSLSVLFARFGPQTNRIMTTKRRLKSVENTAKANHRGSTDEIESGRATPASSFRAVECVSQIAAECLWKFAVRKFPPEALYSLLDASSAPRVENNLASSRNGRVRLEGCVRTARNAISGALRVLTREQSNTRQIARADIVDFAGGPLMIPKDKRAELVLTSIGIYRAQEIVNLASAEMDLI
ncbi:hypothetical protein HN011_010976 [Eciton burchellii]|nr:hypothetical protein HN011_010976 [Eciton burchellii]